MEAAKLCTYLITARTFIQQADANGTWRTQSNKVFHCAVQHRIVIMGTSAMNPIFWDSNWKSFISFSTCPESQILLFHTFLYSHFGSFKSGDKVTFHLDRLSLPTDCLTHITASKHCEHPPAFQIQRKSTHWRIFLCSRQMDNHKKKNGNSEIKNKGIGNKELG